MFNDIYPRGLQEEPSYAREQLNGQSLGAVYLDVSYCLLIWFTCL